MIQSLLFFLFFFFFFMGIETKAIERAFGFNLILRLRFATRFQSFFFFFFFFLRMNSDFTVQETIFTVHVLFCHCICIVYHCSSTVHTLKNIKNGSHDTIYTFKNYFATVFSVFSFQFQQ